MFPEEGDQQGADITKLPQHVQNAARKGMFGVGQKWQVFEQNKSKHCGRVVLILLGIMVLVFVAIWYFSRP